ncbi:hypothetical protein MLD38_004543 [Melastoma candidum]|uniref:Uncharacterized protein n=1 Tax=Melastoma candidum TaxID=119954 RepID=A0ACB9S595_9MYRT|nr:hypothetical protein MLD38_004543 [Melastoma candidum]
MGHGQHRSRSPLFEAAHLVLPYLTPSELAAVAGTCLALRAVSRSINAARSLDASRAMEPSHPIPFLNPISPGPPPLLAVPPYAYFVYSPSRTLSLARSARQPWPSPTESLAGTLGDVEVRVKIVWCGRKGWGLFADQRIEDGQFVCEYAGEVITTCEARRRQAKYDELSSKGGFASALLVIREHLPSGTACLRMNIDATKAGNVARFINHSCDGGNLSAEIIREAGDLLPRVCFFASRGIDKDEELTFSYGEARVGSKGVLPCLCGSPCCLGALPSENT